MILWGIIIGIFIGSTIGVVIGGFLASAKLRSASEDAYPQGQIDAQERGV